MLPFRPPNRVYLALPRSTHVLIAAVLFAAGCHSPATQPAPARVFGRTPDGTDAALFTLTNANGLVAKVTSYGATLTELWVPDRDGKLGDVVLGYDRLEDYVAAPFYLGATLGRVANRIAN